MITHALKHMVFHIEELSGDNFRVYQPVGGINLMHT